MDIFITAKMARLGEKIARNPLQFIGKSTAKYVPRKIDNESAPFIIN